MFLLKQLEKTSKNLKQCGGLGFTEWGITADYDDCHNVTPGMFKSVVRLESGPRDGQSFLLKWGREWGLVEWDVSKNICHEKLRNFEIFAVINKKS